MEPKCTTCGADQPELLSRGEIEPLISELLEELNPGKYVYHHDLVLRVLKAIGLSDAHVKLYIDGELIL